MSQKDKDKKKWYRDNIDRISGYRLSEDERVRMKVNFDLYNNKINQKEFDYVCKPLGDSVGRLPISMRNRDIVSGKVKALLGMEEQRPFSYKVFTTNPEATTAREKKEFGMIRQYVVEQIMAPIRQQLEQEKLQELQQLQAQYQQQTPEPQQQYDAQGMPPQDGIDMPQQPQQSQQPDISQMMQQLDEQYQEKEKTMTPPEIRRYMNRDYQDPAEILSTRLLEYLREKIKIKEKFSGIFKNALLSARGIAYVGILNGEPELWVVNPMYFNFGKSLNSDNIEDSEWAVCEYRMTPSQIARYFGKELKDSDLDEIYSKYSCEAYQNEIDLFADRDASDDNICVVHCVWKALRKIGFLRMIDESGELVERLVEDDMQLPPDMPDASLEWEWIPECYEGWKINVGEGIYIGMRPIPGQFKDIDNAYYCKLPYYGKVYDSYNSDETSIMDRMKYYQYLYNITMYRLELLMSSDKGKKLMMNINNVPDSLGMDVDKWQYFIETSPYIWYNPNEEGSNTGDANTVAKVMDLSLVSDIKKYMEIAEYIRTQCGKSVGVTDQVEGQIGQYEAVRNTRQSIIQTSYILEDYFSTHESCKVNILMALLETAKVCYSMSKPRKLSYIMDDFSKSVLDLDIGLLDNSTFGIFVSSSTKTEQAKELIQQLAQSALQTQTVDFSDIISILNAESATEAEEILKASQEKKLEEKQAEMKQQQEMQQQQQQAMQELERIKFNHQKELTIIKEEERRKTEIVKMSVMGASYNPDHDADNDGMNDFIELSKTTLAQYETEENLKMQRDKMAFEQSMAIGKANRESRKLDIEEKKSGVSQAKYLRKKAMSKSVR